MKISRIAAPNELKSPAPFNHAEFDDSDVNVATKTSRIAALNENELRPSVPFRAVNFGGDDGDMSKNTPERKRNTEENRPPTTASFQHLRGPSSETDQTSTIQSMTSGSQSQTPSVRPSPSRVEVEDGQSSRTSARRTGSGIARRLIESASGRSRTFTGPTSEESSAIPSPPLVELEATLVEEQEVYEATIVRTSDITPILPEETSTATVWWKQRRTYAAIVIIIALVSTLGVTLADESKSNVDINADPTGDIEGGGSLRNRSDAYDESINDASPTSSIQPTELASDKLDASDIGVGGETDAGNVLIEGAEDDLFLPDTSDAGDESNNDAVEGSYSPSSSVQPTESANNEDGESDGEAEGGFDAGELTEYEFVGNAACSASVSNVQCAPSDHIDMLFLPVCPGSDIYCNGDSDCSDTDRCDCPTGQQFCQSGNNPCERRLVGAFQCEYDDEEEDYNLFPLCPDKEGWCDGYADCHETDFCDCPAGEMFCQTGNNPCYDGDHGEGGHYDDIFTDEDFEDISRDFGDGHHPPSILTWVEHGEKSTCGEFCNRFRPVGESFLGFTFYSEEHENFDGECVCHFDDSVELEEILSRYADRAPAVVLSSSSGAGGIAEYDGNEVVGAYCYKVRARPASTSEP
mmetsp:Transcript_19139/g.35782  ORF Transcript_19139/g.35782 Transcript_19139/m.35782 type:complete len:636 (+) Transcript_19139:534-2441(+)